MSHWGASASDVRRRPTFLAVSFDLLDFWEIDASSREVKVKRNPLGGVDGREILDAHLGPEVTLAIITQLGLVSLSASKRIVNAVIEPIFNRIYDEVLNEKLLYLEMRAVQLRRIVESLPMMTPIMKKTSVNRGTFR
jgi:hypothetical protein